MRVLMSFVGGAGHFLPTLPIAQALAARGHSVGYTCQQRLIGTVEAAGFRAADSGGRTLLDAAERRPLLALDRAAEAALLRDFFAGSAAAERAPRIRDIARAQQADVIVSDEIDFGAEAAAAALGIPHVRVIVLAAGGMLSAALVGDRLGALHAALGVPDADPPSVLHGALTVAPVMPSFRDPADPLPESTCFIQPEIMAAPAASHDEASVRVSRWLGTRAGPLVYFTLGTIFHQESGDLFGRVIGALAEVPANVLVTVGHEIDPAELGTLPGNVLAERFVPSRQVIPRSRLVVSHGGSGTTMAALACGVPLVLFPMGADQPWNADRCAALGVGRVLDPLTANADQIAARVSDVLAQPHYRAAAAELHAEAAALPTAEAAAVRVEQLVAGS